MSTVEKLTVTVYRGGGRRYFSRANAYKGAAFALIKAKAIATCGGSYACRREREHDEYGRPYDGVDCRYCEYGCDDYKRLRDRLARWLRWRDERAVPAMTTRNRSLHLLQHALGLDDHGQGVDYRNYYTASPDCDGWELLQEHVAAGRMTVRGPHELYGGGDSYCFRVTDAGREYVRANSPPPPKPSRARKRYLRWLDVSDAYPDMTFGEWLKAECSGGAR